MTLNSERRHKLYEIVPESLPVTREWLLRQSPEFNRHAVDNLLKSGQLIPVTQGVYMRPGTSLTWEGLVCFLQNIQKTDLTVGGITALELKGLAHYIELSNKRTVHLYGKDVLPKWINQALRGVEFIRHVSLSPVDKLDLGSSGLVNDEYDTSLKKLYNGDAHINSLVPTGKANAWPLTRSSPERAFLEVLSDVPDEVSFEYADQLIQGLTTLSPHKMEKLLKRTHNIKARRLFYWFAERYHYAWFKKLPSLSSLDQLGMGTGNRVLVKGGKLDTKYKITVPEDMWTETQNITNKSSY